MLSLIPLAAAEGGFDPLDLSGIGGLFWTIVIFVLAIPFIMKVVMGPIAEALEERDDHVTRAIAAAEKASAEAEKARAEVEVRLGEAQTEAAKLLAEARERAEVREREIVEAAKAEANSMVESARATIRAEQEKALASIRSEVVELSLRAASKVLERHVGGDDDRRFVKELIETVEESRA